MIIGTLLNNVQILTAVLPLSSLPESLVAKNKSCMRSDALAVHVCQVFTWDDGYCVALSALFLLECLLHLLYTCLILQ
jgi:hypothetical protein